MPPPADRPGPEPRRVPDATIFVPEVRDYHQINAQIAQALDAGARHVRLAGVDRQRLLASGLRGGWDATVEVDGNAGPEVGADLDAPGLRVVVIGSAADGAGRALKAGLLLIQEDAGDGLGYAMSGGTIVVGGSVGARAGLEQRGGLIWLGGPVGRLAGDRQAGGRLMLLASHAGPHAGRGRRGGELVRAETPEQVEAMLTALADHLPDSFRDLFPPPSPGPDT